MNTHGDFDATTMERLYELGGPGLVRKLVVLFGEFGGARVADAVTAGRDGDLPGLARAAHALRSTAGNIGATRLLDLATRLETDARAGQRDQVPALVSDLRTAFVAARCYLAEQVGAPEEVAA